MATIERQSRHSRKQMILAGVILGLVLLAGLIYLVFFAAPPRPFDIPGSALQDPAQTMAADPAMTEALLARVQLNLQTEVGLVDWYMQANRETGQPSQSAVTYDAQTQLYYASWLIEHQHKTDFQNWLAAFRTSFVAPDGQVYAQRTASSAETKNILEPADSQLAYWPDTLLFVRVLAQAYDAWPSRSLGAIEQQVRKQFGEQLASGDMTDDQIAIPDAAPTLDPAELPPDPTEVQLDKLPLKAVLRLDTLDLLTLKHLAELDPALQPRYEETLAIVKGGLISDTLPLYAATWYPDNRGYVRFEGTQPAVDLTASLKVALHLAEVGELDRRTQSWLSEHLLNDGALYTTYHIAQGQPVSGEESLTGYALTARLARIAGDAVLYSRAIERLQWHLATSQTSQVRDAIFREVENERIIMTSDDNIWALLAFS